MMFGGRMGWVAFKVSRSLSNFLWVFHHYAYKVPVFVCGVRTVYTYISSTEKRMKREPTHNFKIFRKSHTDTKSY